MPALPTTTGFSNKDVVAAMKALQGTHAGESGGYFIMVEQSPAEALNQLTEVAKQQGAYAETAQLQGSVHRGWASQPPLDLSDLPAPKRDVPLGIGEQEEEAQQQKEKADEENGPLGAWQRLFHENQEAEAQVPAPVFDLQQNRIECVKCTEKGTRTMVREGAPCWLCGHRSGGEALKL
mmetsp:Transcript_31080/g.62740  ORF Transcript_31080/g.62740 Transcript_31080/m.62740 type:complete len:179 (+) Transcript_31080:104-640(+)